MTPGALGRAAARRLAELGCCEITPGLTDAEFTRIEREYGFEFADDHRAFLAEGLPVNSPAEPEPGVVHAWEKPWPEWRDGDGAALRVQLDWPITHILREVAQHGWLDRASGVRLPPGDAAVATAGRLLAGAPRMVPVYAHRFVPAGRGTFGHPVLSMWGTDIIHYGADLLDYVNHEFGQSRPDTGSAHATVPFWRDYL